MLHESMVDSCYEEEDVNHTSQSNCVKVDFRMTLFMSRPGLSTLLLIRHKKGNSQPVMRPGSNPRGSYVNIHTNQSYGDILLGRFHLKLLDSFLS